ncbi:MAG TPA: acyloxyacyl hydrolase [Permianibacter sp.]|nr:acyloxyacyl hydrolase [Permianibacter sp.]
MLRGTLLFGVVLCPGLASALDAAGLVLGKGLNDALIQSDNIASTEIAGVDLRWRTEAADWFDWAEVDELHINLQLAHWRGDHLGEREHLNTIALAALWRWQHENDWFFDASVGAARHSERRYEEVELAGRNQFSLDFAVGRQFAEHWEWSVRYRHYSNGYTARPNPGLDGMVLALSRRF